MQSYLSVMPLRPGIKVLLYNHTVIIMHTVGKLKLELFCSDKQSPITWVKFLYLMRWTYSK